jgi:hypothetical protein
MIKDSRSIPIVRNIVSADEWERMTTILNQKDMRVDEMAKKVKDVVVLEIHNTNVKHIQSVYD